MAEILALTHSISNALKIFGWSWDLKDGIERKPSPARMPIHK